MIFEVWSLLLECFARKSKRRLDLPGDLAEAETNGAYA